LVNVGICLPSDPAEIGLDQSQDICQGRLLCWRRGFSSKGYEGQSSHVPEVKNQGNISDYPTLKQQFQQGPESEVRAFVTLVMKEKRMERFLDVMMK
jgi:hypothetical protein